MSDSHQPHVVLNRYKLHHHCRVRCCCHWDLPHRQKILGIYVFSRCSHFSCWFGGVSPDYCGFQPNCSDFRTSCQTYPKTLKPACFSADCDSSCHALSAVFDIRQTSVIYVYLVQLMTGVLNSTLPLPWPLGSYHPTYLPSPMQGGDTWHCSCHFSPGLGPEHKTKVVQQIQKALYHTPCC